MIFSTKKFNREIKALPELSQTGDVLSSQDQARIKQSLMLEITRQHVNSAPAGFWARHKIILQYAISAALGLSLVAGTAFASGNAIPGDILYPVKITTEKVQLSLATTDQSKAQLQAQFAQQRIVELQKLAAKSPATTPVVDLPPTTASSTLVIAEPSHQSPLEQQARAQAALEVNNALTALKNVQSNLQRHGNTKDAQIIANNITSLQNQAGAQHLLGSGLNNNGSRDENKDHGQNDNQKPLLLSPTATSTSPNQIHIQKNTRHVK